MGSSISSGLFDSKCDRALLDQSPREAWEGTGVPRKVGLGRECGGVWPSSPKTAVQVSPLEKDKMSPKEDKPSIFLMSSKDYDL